MQDVAREADMSPGNIYRYFDSKEALVVGLGERAYGHATILGARLSRAGDRRAELLGIMREYFFGTSREDAILRVDLWSEATRNSAIAALIERGERDFRAWFTDAASSLATSAEFDAEALLATIDALLKGVIVSRALLTEYDPAPAIAQLHAILDAGLAGHLPSQTATGARG